MRASYIIACGVLLVAAPNAVPAQIGGLIRKAKDAATAKAENKVVDNSRLKPSASFGPELTETSLDAVIRGLAAAQSKLSQADEFRTERQRIDGEWAKSSSGHDKDREAYENAKRKAESCQDSVIQTRGQAAQAAYMQRMKNDPAAQAKMMQATMDVSQKSAALQAKGDTAGLRRLMLDLVKAQGIDPKADSVVALKTCGSLANKPAWLVEQDSMRYRSTQLDSQIRNTESTAQSAAVAASGMSLRDYSMARERVLHWSIEARGGSPIQRFGDDERKLLEARRSDIDKYRKALN